MGHWLWSQVAPVPLEVRVLPPAQGQDPGRLPSQLCGQVPILVGAVGGGGPSCFCAVQQALGASRVGYQFMGMSRNRQV